MRRAILPNRLDTDEETDDQPEPIEIEYGETVAECNRWRLQVDGSVVSAVGPEYRSPHVYTTGSPVCLRAWGGEYELSAREVIESYIGRSETGQTQEELRDRVDDIRDIEPWKDEKILRKLYSDELSQEQMAHTLDCTVHDIKKWMQQYDIVVGEHSVDYSRHGEAVGDKRTSDHDREDQFPDKDEILQLHEDGLSPAEIADEVDQAHHVVYCRLDRELGGDTHPADR